MEKMLSVAVAAMLLGAAGCAHSPRYTILQDSEIPQPGHKIKILITDFEDLTGAYRSMEPKFEDALEEILKQDKIKIITNLAIVPPQDPYYFPRVNIFEALPRKELTAQAVKYKLETSELSSVKFKNLDAERRKKIGELTGANFALVGTVQDIYYGPGPYDISAYHFFGLLGDALSNSNRRNASVAFNVQLIRLDNNSVALEGRIEGAYPDMKEDRIDAFAHAVANAGSMFASKLLQRQ